MVRGHVLGHEPKLLRSPWLETAERLHSGRERPLHRSQLHRKRARTSANRWKGISAVNFPNPCSTIYWTATEASEEFAYGFKLGGSKQGKVEKVGHTVNPFVFLSWPVHV